VSLWIKPIILESSLLKYPITKGITRVKQNKIISRLLRIFKSKKSKLSFTPFNNYTSSKVTLYKAIMVFVSGCAQVLTCIPKFEVTLKLCVNERENLVKTFLSFANCNVWTPASIG
jgi:hypothetical protein